MFFLVVYSILIAGLVGIGLNEVYLRVTAKRSAKMITEKEFKDGMRKAQVIDVRDKDSFSAGHILSARNMPYNTIKTSINAIRKDQPIYLYDQKKAWSIRTANLLRKNNYQDIYILKGGYDAWNGKTKKKEKY